MDCEEPASGIKEKQKPINHAQQESHINCEKTNSAEQFRKYPDGGWGWVVVAGCFVMHIFVGGVTRTYGVIYVELKQRFNGTDALISSIGGIHATILLTSSPICTALANRFTTRKVAALGGIIFGLGFIISAFAPSLEFLIFSYAILGGLGTSLIWTPAIVLVSKYFDRRRPVATGLSTVGAGIGIFCFPVLIEYLLSIYGYFGCMLIIGGLLLNTCVCGMLYRPLDTKQSVDEDCTQEIGVPNEPQSTSDRNSQEQATSANMNGEVHIVEQAQKKEGKHYLCSEAFSKYLDLSLLKNWRFILFAISMTMSCVSHRTVLTMLVPSAKQKGVEISRAVFLLSVLGVCDTVARLASGFLFQVSLITNNKTYKYAFCVFMSGGIWFMHPLLSTYVHFMIMSAVFGLFHGVLLSQRVTVTEDLLGIEKISSTLSLTLLWSGLGLLVGPYIAGYLKDATGEYNASFIFAGVLATTGSLLMVINDKVNHKS